MELSADHGDHSHGAGAGADDVPMAAQLSQAQIIERQAYSIDKLKRQAEKSSEYKRLTKVKLKEAAQRLREYRQRVEALMQEVADGKRALQAQKEAAVTPSASGRGRGATQGRGRGRGGAGRMIDASVSVVLSTREIAVQTDAPRRTTADGQAQTQLSGEVQLVPRKGVNCAVQTVTGVSEQHQETEMKPTASRKRQRSFHREEDLAQQAEGAQMTSLISRRPVEKGLLPLSAGAASGKATRDAVGTPLEPFVLSKSPLKIMSMPFTTETSSAIDAELALSDSEDEDGDGALVDTLGLSLVDQAPLPLDVLPAAEKNGPPLQVVGLDAAVSSEIDRELEMSSDDGSDHKDASSEPLKVAAGPVDAPSRGNSLLASIDAEIDAELETSESETELEKAPDAGEGTEKEAESSSSSSDYSDSDSSDSSDGDSNGGGDAAMDGIVDEIELDLAERGDAAVEEQAASALPTPLSDNPASEHGELSEPRDNKAEKVTYTSTPATETGRSDHVSPSQMDGKSMDSAALTAKEPGVPVTVESSQHMGSAWSRAFKTPAASHDPQKLAVARHNEPVPSSNSGAESETPIAKTQVSDLLQPDRDSTPADAEQVERSASADTGQVSTTAQDTDSAVSQENASMVVPDEAGQGLVEETECRPTETNALGPPHSGEAADVSASNDGNYVPDVEAIANAVTAPAPLPGTAVEEDSKKVKAHEAVPCGAEPPAVKKRKLETAIPAPGVPTLEIPPISATSTASTSVDAKPDAVTQERDGSAHKHELNLGKAVSAFKRDIGLAKKEEIDEAFVRRTISALVKSSAMFVITHPEHVIKLCQVLGSKYRTLHVSPMTMVRGAVRVLRTPRSRHMAGNESLELSRLCHQVLLALACDGDDLAAVQDGTKPSDVLYLSLELEKCLSYLREFLVPKRMDLGGQLFDSVNIDRAQQQLVAQKHAPISHDKAFLVHACAFHTRVCRSLGLLKRSRGLLFDVVRSNPNIRGLALADVMLDIAPEIMAQEFDYQCREHRMPLKSALLHALVVISNSTTRNLKIFQGETGVAMLNRISDSIQMPELMEVDAEDEQFRNTFLEELWIQLAAQCQDPSAEPSKDERVNLFKSLELCAVVYSEDCVVHTFSVERFQELMAGSNSTGKAGVLEAVGHIALAVSNKKNSRRRDAYVSSVLYWFQHVLAVKAEEEGEVSSGDDESQLQFQYASVCIELLLASSASEVDYPRRLLCAVLEWFDRQTSERVWDLPASFLRRLRHAVMSTRPLVLV